MFRSTRSILSILLMVIFIGIIRQLLQPAWIPSASAAGFPNIIGQINLGNTADFAAVNPTTNRLYVSTFVRGSSQWFSVIDGNTNKVLTTISPARFFGY